MINELIKPVQEIKECDCSEDILQVIEVFRNFSSEPGLTIYDILNQLDKIIDELKH